MMQRWSQSGGTRRGVGGAMALVAALVVALPVPAAAKLGDGLKVGPGRLRLGIDAEGRYDSMVGAGSFGILGGGDSSANPGDGVGKLRGNLNLDVPGQNYKLTLTGGVDWNQYFGLFVNTSALSFLGANGAFGLNVNPNGAVGFELTDGFSRSDRTTNPIFGLGVISLSNNLRGRLRLKPGGGALEGGLSFDYIADRFTPQASLADDSGATGVGACPGNDPTCDPTKARVYNADTLRFGIDGKWRLLPKTGITFESTFALRSYPNADPSVTNVPATPLRALLGFGTLLTTRLSFNVKAGYQGMFFSDTAVAALHTWLAQGELGYRLTETLQLRGGYVRSFDPVGGQLIYFGNNRIFGDFRAQFSRLVLAAGASFDVISFGGVLRQDVAFAVNGRADYNVTDWMRVGGGLAFNTRSSSSGAVLPYSRWEASFGVGTLF